MVENILPPFGQALTLLAIEGLSLGTFFGGIEIGKRLGKRIHGKPVKELTREVRSEQIFKKELRIVEGR